MASSLAAAEVAADQGALDRLAATVRDFRAKYQALQRLRAEMVPSDMRDEVDRALSDSRVQYDAVDRALRAYGAARDWWADVRSFFGLGELGFLPLIPIAAVTAAIAALVAASIKLTDTFQRAAFWRAQEKAGKTPEQIAALAKGRFGDAVSTWATWLKYGAIALLALTAVRALK